MVQKNVKFEKPTLRETMPFTGCRWLLLINANLANLFICFQPFNETIASTLKDTTPIINKSRTKTKKTNCFEMIYYLMILWDGFLPKIGNHLVKKIDLSSKSSAYRWIVDISNCSITKKKLMTLNTLNLVST